MDTSRLGWSRAFWMVWANSTLYLQPRSVNVCRDRDSSSLPTWRSPEAQRHTRHHCAPVTPRQDAASHSRRRSSQHLRSYNAASGAAAPEVEAVPYGRIPASPLIIVVSIGSSNQTTVECRPSLSPTLSYPSPAVPLLADCADRGGRFQRHSRRGLAAHIAKTAMVLRVRVRWRSHKLSTAWTVPVPSATPPPR